MNAIYRDWETKSKRVARKNGGRIKAQPKRNIYNINIRRQMVQKFEKINTNLFSVVEFLLIFLIIYIISYVEEYKAIYASFIFLVIVFFFAFEKGVLSKILKASFFQLLS